VATSKKEEDLPPVEKPQQESSHRTFSEFLDCVRNSSVDERRAALKGPNAWMAEPVGPCKELFTVEGKEPLRDIWDRWPEFQGAGLESIQTQFEECLSDMYNSGVIANAVWSCMLEHSEELESRDGQEEEIEQEIQDPQEGIPLTTDESEDLEGGKTAANTAKELDRAAQPVTFEDIEAALEAGDREKAVELWQQLRKASGKERTKAFLYRTAGQDKRDFRRWCQGKHPDGSTPDKDIKKALTTDWD